MSRLAKIVVHRDDDDAEPYCEFGREDAAGMGGIHPRWVESDDRAKPVSRRLQAILDDLEAALMAEDYWGDDLTPEVKDVNSIDKQDMNPIDKRIRLVERFAWREPQGGVPPGLAKVDEVAVEVTVNWSKLASLAYKAAHGKTGRATAYHGAIEARVAKGTPRLASQQPFEEAQS